VITNNFGGFNTGYRAWKFEAKRAVCEETITLTRADWWTGDTMTQDVKIFVTPVTCDNVCPIGKKQATATSCECVPIETEASVGILFQAHEVAVGTTVRVWMKKDEPNMDSVTLR
jgi:hypothetical protein